MFEATLLSVLIFEQPFKSFKSLYVSFVGKCRTFTAFRVSGGCTIFWKSAKHLVLEKPWLGLGFMDFGDLETGAVSKKMQGLAGRRRLVDRVGAKPNLMAIAARAKAQMLVGKIPVWGSVTGFFRNGLLCEAMDSLNFSDILLGK